MSISSCKVVSFDLSHLFSLKTSIFSLFKFKFIVLFFELFIVVIIVTLSILSLILSSNISPFAPTLNLFLSLSSSEFDSSKPKSSLSLDFPPW